MYCVSALSLHIESTDSMRVSPSERLWSVSHQGTFRLQDPRCSKVGKNIEFCSVCQGCMCWNNTQRWTYAV